MAEEDPQQQLALIGPRGGLLPRPSRIGVTPPAPVDPVARVLVDSPVPHLARVFDYLVPAPLDGLAVPGVRVRVPFAGQRLDGYVVERCPLPQVPRALRDLIDVVAPDVVLPLAARELAADVAGHYAGTMADVVRLAVPPRHGAAEAAARSAEAGAQVVVMPAAVAAARAAADALWKPYSGSGALLDAVGDPAPGLSMPAAASVWQCLPGTDWADQVAALLALAAAGGVGAIAVVPDARDLARLHHRLAAHLDRREFSVLTAGDGPAQRHREYLEVARGVTRVVIGTRSAVYAPVHDLGLLLVWDDGDDSHADRRAPYPHSREVAAMRATGGQVHGARAHLVVGGYAITPQTQRWVSIGWALPVVAATATVRAHAPVVRASTDSFRGATAQQRAARIPPLAARTIREGLDHGPVLVLVGRRGYVPALACGQCRERAACERCGGSLQLTEGRSPPACDRCAALAGGWVCPHCGGGALRALSIGGLRTAEELGRAFPGALIRTVDADHPRTEVGPEPAVVVATVGAQPWPSAGYAAAVVLDAGAILRLPGLRAQENALRGWCNALAMVRPRGQVTVVGDGAWPVVQALIRWDPAGWADRELRLRAQAGMPPAVRAAEMAGPADDLDDALADLPAAVTVLGPVPLTQEDDTGPRARALLTWPYAASQTVVAHLQAVQVTRSAERRSALHLHVDPVEPA